MRGFPSDHRVPTRVVAGSVRQAGGALDSSEESGYQQSIESEVDEFAEHRCRWLCVVVV